MSRDLKDLHPDLRWRAEKLIEQALAASIPIMIYRTLASFAEQQALYDEGRTRPGKIVTNAKAGESYHNYGLALDFCIDPPGPGVEWRAAVDINEDQKPDYQQIGELGEDLGFQWGGRWKKQGLGDVGHLQMSFGYHWRQLLQMYQSGGLSKVWAAIDEKIEKRLWP